MAFWTEVVDVNVGGAVANFTSVAKLHAVDISSKHFNEAQLDILLAYLGGHDSVVSDSTSASASGSTSASASDSDPASASASASTSASAISNNSNAECKTSPAELAAKLAADQYANSVVAEHKAEHKAEQVAKCHLRDWRGDRLLRDARVWGLLSSPSEGEVGAKWNSHRTLQRHTGNGSVMVAHLCS